MHTYAQSHIYSFMYVRYDRMLYKTNENIAK